MNVEPKIITIRAIGAVDNLNMRTSEIAAVQVDNPSDMWLQLMPINTYVPPHTVGYRITVVPTTAMLTVNQVAAPPGGEVSAVNGGPAVITLYDDNAIGIAAGIPYAAATKVDISAINTRLDTLNTSEQATKASVDLTKAAVDASKTLLDTDLASVNANVVAVDGHVSTVNTNVIATDTDVKAVKTATDANTTSVNAVKTSTDAIKVSTDLIQSATNPKIDAVKASTDTLQTKVDNVATQVTSVQAKVDALSGGWGGSYSIQRYADFTDTIKGNNVAVQLVAAPGVGLSIYVVSFNIAAAIIAAAGSGVKRIAWDTYQWYLQYTAVPTVIAVGVLNDASRLSDNITFQPAGFKCAANTALQVRIQNNFGSSNLGFYVVGLYYVAP